MPQILDPANTADNTAFDGIRDLAHTTSTNAEIASSPLFLAAEDFILDVDGMAADRNYAHRSEIVLALQFLTAAYLLQGGGETASSSSTTTTGVVESQTILGQTTRYSAGGSTHAVRVTNLEIESRIKFLENQAHEILRELHPTQSIGTVDSLPSPVALTTESKLVE